jgi:MHS family proline/betaine transporter-like MFS transporter
MKKVKLILSSAIANVFEWYDYALFGLFAPIIGRKFFPDQDPKVSLLSAFFVFAVGYLMRPLGGILFGIIGDKYGRKVALSSAVICMSIPTALIGLLPTYQSIGITATICMVIVRMLQGISMGGVLTGSVSFIIEHTNKKYRGFVGSIPMSSICLGILLGSIISYITRRLMIEQSFEDFGWRFPFIIGILIFFAGMYIKTHTEDTPLFLELQDSDSIVKSPLRLVFRSYWKQMLISIAINSTGSVLFYFQAIYLMSFLKISRGFSDIEIGGIANLCYIIMAFSCLVAGWLSDIVGRIKIFIVLNIIIIVCHVFGLMDYFDNGGIKEILVGQIILSILASFYIGPEPALQAELYPTEVRNTALSISYNTATSVFGGTAPYLIEYLVQNHGGIRSSGIYLSLCSVISIIGLYFYKKPLSTK